MVICRVYTTFSYIARDVIVIGLDLTVFSLSEGYTATFSLSTSDLEELLVSGAKNRL